MASRKLIRPMAHFELEAETVCVWFYVFMALSLLLVLAVSNKKLCTLHVIALILLGLGQNEVVENTSKEDI
jgi:hypothetical protein